MKKYLFGLVIILTLSIIAILPAKGYARWVLYDDFNYEDGIPDPDLWEIEYFPPALGPSATIEVKDGEAVFTHDPTVPNCSAWLKIKNIKKVKAVRVTVRFDDPCSGDVRGRIGAYIGQDDEGNYIGQNIQVKDSRIIDIGTGANSPIDGSKVYQMFYSALGCNPWNPSYRIDPFYGEDFTIQMSLNRYLHNFRAFGFGITSFIRPQRIFKYHDSWAGIGTRNSFDPGCEGSCPCTIYFDDVYVKY